MYTQPTVLNLTPKETQLFFEALRALKTETVSKQSTMSVEDYKSKKDRIKNLTEKVTEADEVRRILGE